jgi:hypothetical protein
MYTDARLLGAEVIFFENCVAPNIRETNVIFFAHSTYTMSCNCHIDDVSVLRPVCVEAIF